VGTLLLLVLLRLLLEDGRRYLLCKTRDMLPGGCQVEMAKGRGEDDIRDKCSSSPEERLLVALPARLRMRL
jgi:hypothetical protein